MHGRLSENDVTNTVNVESPAAVCAEVRRMLEHRYPGTSFAVLDRVFQDVEHLFTGRMPGFEACDTLYHDLRHTLDVTLAMARLIDGHDRIKTGDERMGAQRALVGVVTALLHDAGYIRHRSDRRHRHGAEYTRIHVRRSANFLRGYLAQIGLAAWSQTAARVVHFTGYEISPDRIFLDDPRDRRLGFMLGSADLIAQMADRAYLEKCRDYLYNEFVMAGLDRETMQDGTVMLRFHSADDLLAKTPEFHDKVVNERLDRSFDRVHRYAAVHFDGHNPYLDQMASHIRHLRKVLDAGRPKMLRRKANSLSAPKRRDSRQAS